MNRSQSSENRMSLGLGSSSGSGVGLGGVPIRQPSPRNLSPSGSPPAGGSGGIHQPVPLAAAGLVGGSSISSSLNPQASTGSLGHLGGTASPSGLHLPHHISRPSSPASIHSSTSAIFERDIELPAVQALSLQPTAASPTPHTFNHKPSRLGHLSHGSTLDHTVPAVLDDAVEALAEAGTGTSRGLQGLEIEAPAPASGIAMARQSSASLAGIQRKGSGLTAAFATPPRSPSPATTAGGVSRSSSMTPGSPPILSPLGQLGGLIRPAGSGHTGEKGVPLSPSSPLSPATSADAADTSPTATPLGVAPASAVRPPMQARTSTGPQLPGGWWSSFNEDKEKGGGAAAPTAAPTSAVVAEPSPLSGSTTAGDSSSSLATGGGGVAPVSALPAHLSPNKQQSTRRISFLSPTDLLLSVPTQVTPLGEITSGHLSPEHLPGTISPSLATTGTIAGQGVLPGRSSSALAGEILGGAASPSGTVSPSASVGTGAAGATAPPGLASKDSIAAMRGPADGEWAREGLGKGLEQRLEDLVQGGR